MRLPDRGERDRRERRDPGAGSTTLSLGLRTQQALVRGLKLTPHLRRLLGRRGVERRDTGLRCLRARLRDLQLVGELQHTRRVLLPRRLELPLELLHARLLLRELGRAASAALLCAPALADRPFKRAAKLSDARAGLLKLVVGSTEPAEHDAQPCVARCPCILCTLSRRLVNGNFLVQPLRLSP